ncbi:hypothetical protein PPACK8108_LOCUS11469 [Phakopsora pachyrhizi]|uniref:Uncharacterized protein n=1 Tax=Phakopsora pachyrhizi TaxID=170000 RepID=A0AAV0B263_PHAPC|nr:hypothetical protein PPACK8108_LOCUS11469 [Phakopsora pachyrhizi]
MLDVSISEARSSFRIAGDLKDCKRPKSQKESISNGFQSINIPAEKFKLLEKKNQLNCNDKAVLLLHEKIQKSILKDFEKLFKRISKNIYPDNFAENSQVMPLAFDIIDWLALNELNKGIIMKNLLKNKDVIKGLDLYISTKIIHNRGYIEIFKADDIQQYLLKHQDLEHIINLLNCDNFVFALLLLN